MFLLILILPSDDNSEECNNVRENDISYVNNPKDEETIEKIAVR